MTTDTTTTTPLLPTNHRHIAYWSSRVQDTLLELLELHPRERYAYRRLAREFLRRFAKGGPDAEVLLPKRNHLGKNRSCITVVDKFIDELKASNQTFICVHSQTSTSSRKKLRGGSYVHMRSLDEDWDTAVNRHISQRQAEQSYRACTSATVNPERALELFDHLYLATELLSPEPNKETAQEILDAWANGFMVDQTAQDLRDYYKDIIVTLKDTHFGVTGHGEQSDTRLRVTKNLKRGGELVWRQHQKLRFYSAGWHNVSAEVRNDFVVANKKTREVIEASQLDDVDIRAMAFAHSLFVCGTKDPKAIQTAVDKRSHPNLLPGFTPRQVKDILNRIIHGGVSNCASEVLGRGMSFPYLTYNSNKDVVSALVTAIPEFAAVIAKVENEKNGAEDLQHSYQEVEGDWTHKMVMLAQKRGWTVLTMHDGFIVPKKNSEEFAKLANMVLPDYLSVAVEDFVTTNNRKIGVTPNVQATTPVRTKLPHC
jgi:hypothetical protein